MEKLKLDGSFKEMFFFHRNFFVILEWSVRTCLPQLQHKNICMFLIRFLYFAQLEMIKLTEKLMID
uniref:Ovule protein n=1 Tax=Romanomermis culicivorax TaxID=13658 RepID=A0A915KYG1_ROMCU